jgi:flavin reductase (DIM6/NTAB) family NADH-FMN oxidoreductase RutF
MNETSATLPRGVSEFVRAGLSMAPGLLVGAPRVAESPCALECRLVHALELHDVDGRPTDRHVLFGQVMGVHLDETLVVDGRFDTARARPVARCGYLGDYAVVDQVFQMTRPAE